MLDTIKKDAATRMGKSIDSLELEMAKIRTGRANVSLLDHVLVEYYGNEVPINQVANVNVEDARTLTVVPWERDMVSKVEKAIMNSDLGLNPATMGTVIRVPLPSLTEDRRKELVKVVRHEAENARVAIRNIRRDANNELKLRVKDKSISEDDERRGQEEVQKLTDQYIARVEKVLEQKEKDLMAI